MRHARERRAPFEPGGGGEQAPRHPAGCGDWAGGVLRRGPCPRGWRSERELSASIEAPQRLTQLSVGVQDRRADETSLLGSPKATRSDSTYAIPARIGRAVNASFTASEEPSVERARRVALQSTSPRCTRWIFAVPELRGFDMSVVLLNATWLVATGGSHETLVDIHRALARLPGLDRVWRNSMPRASRECGDVHI